jgi:hypothetical protein
MNALRRTLYLQAAVSGLLGLALTVAPGFTAHTILRRGLLFSTTWPRLFGIQSIGLAMLMVLVGHRLEDLWWWTWAFAFVSVAGTVVLILTASFGLGPLDSALPWWLFSLIGTAFSAGLLYGLFVVSRERPLM